MALTKKQEIFCREYLIDLNATQAAIRAGYSKKTAYSHGQRLLKNVEVQKRIQQLMDQRVKKLEINADALLAEVGRIAFADVGDFSDFKIRSPKDIKKLPEHIRRYVIGWSYSATGIFNLRFADKVKCLELYGKHLKLFTDKIEIEDKTPTEDKVRVGEAMIDAAFAKLENDY